MNEKRLDDLEFSAKHNASWAMGLVGDEDFELLRLARLGLWAEQHAIPNFKYGVKHGLSRDMSRDALAKLPASREGK